MSATYNEVLKRLIEERKRLVLSQQEMARLVHITQSNYSKVEKGLHRLSYEELKYLSKANVDIFYILTGYRCAGKYVEYFQQYTYVELCCYLGIIYSLIVLNDWRSNTEPWKDIAKRVKYVPLVLDCKKSSNIFLVIRHMTGSRQKPMAEKLGVDIKKFAINIGLINFKGDMVELKMNIPFKSENTSEALEELCKLILQFIKKVDIDNDKILNININVSGRVNPESGYSFSQFNFEERPLAEVLTEKIGFRVTIDNDTRAMTYGEYMKGCVKGEKDIIFVNVSWGLGIGIIIDGKIYTGKSGFSGEFGHTNVFDNEIICHCGKKGCLETEASGSALHRILIERIQNGESSILSNRILSKDNVLTLDEIIASVNKEDLLCIEIVEEIGQKLGKQIAGLINIFNPELVIIGGTLSLTGDYITQPIKTAVRKYSLNLVNKDSAIMTSKLKDKAGIVGACMLARSRMFES